MPSWFIFLAATGTAAFATPTMSTSASFSSRFNSAGCKKSVDALLSKSEKIIQNHEHLRIADLVKDSHSLADGSDQARLAQHHQMLGDIGLWSSQRCG